MPRSVTGYLGKATMRRLRLIAIVLIVSVTLWSHYHDHAASSDSPESTITYRGQVVQLSKPYDSYEDYKDDPDNIAPTETARVQQLVQNASMPKQVGDRSQMIKAVLALAFPGYGSAFYGAKPQADGSVFELTSVEIPRSGNSRFLLFHEVGGTYFLIDDFVYADSATISSVARSGDSLVYSTMQGTLVLKRKFNGP